MRLDSDALRPDGLGAASLRLAIDRVRQDADDEHPIVLAVAPVAALLGEGHAQDLELPVVDAGKALPRPRCRLAELSQPGNYRRMDDLRVVDRHVAGEPDPAGGHLVRERRQPRRVERRLVAGRVVLKAHDRAERPSGDVGIEAVEAKGHPSGLSVGRQRPAAVDEHCGFVGEAGVVLGEGLGLALLQTVEGLRVGGRVAGRACAKGLRELLGQQPREPVLGAPRSGASSEQAQVTAERRDVVGQASALGVVGLDARPEERVRVGEGGDEVDVLIADGGHPVPEHAGPPCGVVALVPDPGQVSHE